MRAVLLLCAISSLLFSCTNDRIEPLRSVDFVEYTQGEYQTISKVLDLPVKFDQYNGRDGFLSAATKGTLGRVLFYDTQLSKDNSVSCASCHKQENAFADPVDFSEGIYGRLTDRNSIALGSFSSFADEYGDGGGSGALNSGKPLFWDLRAESIHQQMTETIANDKEMGMQLSEIVDRLEDDEHYRILFRKAYGTSEISEGRILSALETFMLAMESHNSLFDRALDKFSQVSTDYLVASSLSYFTTEQNHGKTLFMTNCASCHMSTLAPKVQTPFNSETIASNNGLDVLYSDKGLGSVTGSAHDMGKFKVPSLRNIRRTHPYMHDGRFETLEEVIEFYNEGVQPHHNLSNNLKGLDGAPIKMNFDEHDKESLIAFLETLDDMSEIGQSKFSDPWK